MSTASLELLKGSQVKPVADAGTNAGSEPGEEEVVVDIDKLTGKELDALVLEHEVETPDGWAKLPVAAKKAWLKANFGDEEEQLSTAE